ncbi:MAG: sortase, partial [Roseiflexus sp.]|nr:sortase [Roseiflexus sp.]
MSVQPSHQPGSTHQEDETLLETLISTPLAPTKAWQKPIVLRSLDEHRRYALKGYRLRTWVDH